MNINNKPTIKPQTITGIFTKYIAKTLPLAFDESMSYYECLCALLEYINDTIVPDINNVNGGLSELQSFYTELQNYVNHYFDNLDVQEEINNKLDEMAEDGSLTALIGNYVNPYITDIQNQVNSLANGSPLKATSTSDMTDTNRIYVNTTDGYWYYYNGTNWVQGGVYQATQFADGSITPSLTTFYNLNSIIPYDDWITGSVYYENDGHLGTYTNTSAYNPKQVPITPNTKLIYHNENGINGLKVHYFNGSTYISSSTITNNATSIFPTPPHLSLRS